MIGGRAKVQNQPLEGILLALSDIFTIHSHMTPSSQEGAVTYVPPDPVKPLVSILIPAYNAERWIGATIQSSLGQTWPNTEIIVVDDGSKDRTLDEARRFESRGVVVVAQKNQGASAARNKAFSLSRGTFIQWLDADDLLAPDKISRQMESLGHQPDPRVLLSGGWGMFYFRTSKARFVPTLLWRDLTPREFITIKLGQADCFMQTATWLVSRQLTEAAGPWDVSLSYDDDGEYFCRVLMASETVRFVPASRVYYRVTDSARLSHVGTSHRKLESLLRAMEMQIRYLRSLADSEESRAACVRYLQRYLFHFYGVRPDLVDKMERLAIELGGKLEPPRTRRNYYWIQKLFGWNVAIRAQSYLPGIKASLVKKWDRVRFWMERGNAA